MYTDLANHTQVSSKDLQCRPDTDYTFKMLSAEICPIITSIVNSSINLVVFPDVFKLSTVTPIPKSRNLKAVQAELLMNYRPVANLPFVSKVLEKVVALQLTNHMTRFMLHEPFQSAYKRHHGTETALTRIQNDIWKNMDEGKVCNFLSPPYMLIGGATCSRLLPYFFTAFS